MFKIRKSSSLIFLKYLLRLIDCSLDSSLGLKESVSEDVALNSINIIPDLDSASSEIDASSKLQYSMRFQGNGTSTIPTVHLIIPKGEDDSDPEIDLSDVFHKEISRLFLTGELTEYDAQTSLGFPIGNQIQQGDRKFLK